MARRKTNNRKKTAHAILNAKNISLLFVLLLAVSYIFLLSRQTGVLGIWSARSIISYSESAPISSLCI